MAINPPNSHCDISVWNSGMTDQQAESHIINANILNNLGPIAHIHSGLYLCNFGCIKYRL